MNTPRFAFAALVSALAAAPALSQTAPLTPISMGPAAAGQCVIGSDGCGLARGAAMDPVAEGVLVGLGQRAVPTLGGPALKKAPLLIAAKNTDDSETASGTDLVAIGGQIINPPAVPFRSATGMTLGAAAPAPALGRQAAFDTRVDASGIAAAEVPKASGLSYIQTQKVEATLGGKGAAFGADPKLSAGDADFASGGTSASSNGSR